MIESNDKKSFITKFLNHIQLGTEDELVLFNSRISFINITFWIFIFAFLTALIIKPDYFSFYNIFTKSNILKFLNINKEDLKILLFLANFSVFVYIAYITRSRKEKIESLFGLRILLDYMRVDESEFLKELKNIFPTLNEFELIEFTNAVFTKRLLKK
ncbi:Hypothetical protein LBF_5027 (plasmid) [Leptospira biflexa serovar Patoc strain 'Patoc 1 (Ames)']|uniref:Uncharacterized protein n=1 Tax=Leptospira biflexa serovar Patoc (strain Patoc 1 / ATCC 23582 / Paris) TaxID=456481 RepID=B0SUF8_LEPBP|nr:hypothetical protein [Leptospira biflexa]ABZ96118.1 Hypothetical protein LBF_5027 [Leptospira biflexa serovar Patoc strain 'Patoc 1 (Ames)']ABZ99842.1 Hypothetical protein LEPBI_p0028 [Leptospira biflexa serovar Patoc strain 'Patoc 1 (Paris)']